MQKRITVSCIIIFVMVFLSLQDCFSFSIVKNNLYRRDITVASPSYLKASVFVNMTARDFATATGKKLNFFQKIYFKVVQHQVKRDLKSNPDLLITDYYDQKKAKFKLDLLWFVIGAFIGPFGLLAAYTSRQRKGGPTKKKKITSVWLGFLVFFIWFGYVFLF